jgi:hypothetical protein
MGGPNLAPRSTATQGFPVRCPVNGVVQVSITLNVLQQQVEPDPALARVTRHTECGTQPGVPLPGQYHPSSWPGTGREEQLPTEATAQQLAGAALRAHLLPMTRADLPANGCLCFELVELLLKIVAACEY